MKFGTETEIDNDIMLVNQDDSEKFWNYARQVSYYRNMSRFFTQNKIK